MFDAIADHRARYPEQYSHPLCGKRVKVTTEQGGYRGTGVVERVVNCRFGQLAVVPDISKDTWWRIQDCQVA